MSKSIIVNCAVEGFAKLQVTENRNEIGIGWNTCNLKVKAVECSRAETKLQTIVIKFSTQCPSYSDQSIDLQVQELCDGHTGRAIVETVHKCIVKRSCKKKGQLLEQCREVQEMHS